MVYKDIKKYQSERRDQNRKRPLNYSWENPSEGKAISPSEPFHLFNTKCPPSHPAWRIVENVGRSFLPTRSTAALARPIHHTFQRDLCLREDCSFIVTFFPTFLPSFFLSFLPSFLFFPSSLFLSPFLFLPSLLPPSFPLYFFILNIT